MCVPQMPGASDVVARGNPMGKGPVLMHIPQYVVNEIRKRSADGNRQFKQVELNLFRCAQAVVGMVGHKALSGLTHLDHVGSLLSTTPSAYDRFLWSR